MDPEAFGVAFDVLEHVLGICWSIYQAVKTAKSNKERCKQVSQRVRLLEQMVMSLKHQPERVTDNVRSCLLELIQSLTRAMELVKKISNVNSAVGFFNANAHESKFQEISQKLSEDVQLLSVALQINDGGVLQEVSRNVRDQVASTTVPCRHSLEHGQHDRSVHNPQSPVPMSPVPTSAVTTSFVPMSPVPMSPVPISPVTTSLVPMSPISVVLPPPLVFQSQPVVYQSSSVFSYSVPRGAMQLMQPLSLMTPPQSQILNKKEKKRQKYKKSKSVSF
uniref:uncharacterized protein LOC131138525 isoform X2 n=1 Tax=Doryrhamphus excisus TaxID=161450 RepID=UPI0025ADF514|nr:uncharacterized protein LOC131138525 isoform X2 [Doryrhamphus excisus]